MQLRILSRLHHRCKAKVQTQNSSLFDASFSPTDQFCDASYRPNIIYVKLRSSPKQGFEIGAKKSLPKGENISSNLPERRTTYSFLANLWMELRSRKASFSVYTKRLRKSVLDLKWKKMNSKLPCSSCCDCATNCTSNKMMPSQSRILGLTNEFQARFRA